MSECLQCNLTRLLTISAKLCTFAETCTVMAQAQLHVLNATAIQVLSGGADGL
jgi:hypothetical protein